LLVTPYFEAAQPAGVLRDVATEGALVQAGGVGRVVEPARHDGLVEVVGEHAGLDDGKQVVRVDLQDAVKLREVKHDAAARGDRATGEVRRAASGNDGDPLAIRDHEHGGDLLDAARQNDTLRTRFEPCAVD